tara:strand:+ start:652 stop:870 length:219 start_codon:yes stop_codon:yes gene_type:complete
MIFGIEDLSFKPEQADSIIQYCEAAGMSDMEIWLHCLSVAVGTCPNKDMTLAAVQMIYQTENILKNTEGTIQ